MNLDHAELPVVLIAGPTAVGKTAFSIDLASLLDTEIVNADSMQVYRFMDIGTAKPTPRERALVTHHLLDVVRPDEPFDAALYGELARPVLEDLHRRGRVPVVVGGTGLYMKVLTRGICPAAPRDQEVRERLLLREKEIGLSGLHEELARVDPVLGGRIHPNDRQRILRALEVYRATGKRLSERQEEHRFEGALYRTVKIFLTLERDEIYERIDLRVHRMLEEGFRDEVARLLDMGFGPDLRPMRSLGYRQLARHLVEGWSLDEAIHDIQKETRRYAKRQMTWFRGDPEFRWFDARRTEEIMDWVVRRVRSLSGGADAEGA